MSQADPSDDRTLNLTVYPDPQPEATVDPHDVVEHPTEEELAAGKEFGESIDVDDDDDAGVSV
jgi:hypothetical protein